jgi:hypothetical protein
MTADAFRTLALRFPGAEERAHQGHPDFRVNGRVFATLGYPAAGWAMVALTPDDQAAFVALAPTVFVPVKGRWGAQGYTNVVLRHARPALLGDALAAAHEAKSKSKPWKRS